MDRDKMGACPFCGGIDIFTERADFSSSYVVCNNCLARGPVKCQDDDDEDEPGQAAAIAAWIRRPAQSDSLCPCCKDPRCSWGGIPANCQLWGKEPAQPDISGLVEALEPVSREIDRLEAEYGFDRPFGQLQPLMIACGHLIKIRNAIAATKAGGGA